jgi:hypothetical protein
MRRGRGRGRRRVRPTPPPSQAESGGRPVRWVGCCSASPRRQRLLRARARTISGLTLSPLPSTTCSGVAPSESFRSGSTPLARAWASATMRPSRTISCRIVVNRSPRADSSMRRPASAPASIRATTMPADSERTPYQSGDAPHGSTGSGSAPHASSSITSELPLRARPKRSSTFSGNGVVHAGGSTPSAPSTIRVPSRLSPRSYHGHGPSPLATKSATAMRDSSVIALP